MAIISKIRYNELIKQWEHYSEKINDWSPGFINNDHIKSYDYNNATKVDSTGRIIIYANSNQEVDINTNIILNKRYVKTDISELIDINKVIPLIVTSINDAINIPEKILSEIELYLDIEIIKIVI